jgi:hypothetical protein
MNITFHHYFELLPVLDSPTKIDTHTWPKDYTMPNILDTARHPTKANGDALPALRLFEDYVTESSECLRYSSYQSSSADP